MSAFRPGVGAEGLRARKQRQTRERIAQAGLSLFLERGFEATTLDAIARAADISRRTVFHYFASKEAIVEAIETGAQESFSAALAASAADLPPLDAIRDVLLTGVSHYQTDEAIAIDRLMRSTAALRARKQANYERQEKALFAALCEKWPGHDQGRLRLVAMVGIGALRLAAEQWSTERGHRPLQEYLADAFAGLP